MGTASREVFSVHTEFVLLPPRPNFDCRRVAPILLLLHLQVWSVIG